MTLMSGVWVRDAMDVDWTAFRAEFPALKAQTYMNTAGGGPICKAAAAAGAAYYADLAESGDKNWPLWLAEVEDCRKRVASLLNAKPHQIAFVQNVSLALNYVASVTAGAETRVAMPTDEFPSVSLAWINRGSRIMPFGFTEAGTPHGMPDMKTVDWIVASQVQYRSGVALDLQEINQIRTLLQTGLVLDSTQAFGVTTLDLEKTPVDALGFSVYKWAGAGYGVGVLYLRDGFLDQYGYPAVGWRSSDDPYALVSERLTTTGGARDLELGHPPIPAVLALNQALKLIEQVSVAAIEQRVATLVDSLRAALTRLGLEVLTPAELGRRAAITVVRHHDAPALAAALKERDIWVSQFDDKLRISCHAYNNEEDISSLSHALQELL